MQFPLGLMQCNSIQTPFHASTFLRLPRAMHTQISMVAVVLVARQYENAFSHLLLASPSRLKLEIIPHSSKAQRITHEHILPQHFPEMSYTSRSCLDMVRVACGDADFHATVGKGGVDVEGWRGGVTGMQEGHEDVFAITVCVLCQRMRNVESRCGWRDYH